jgi:GNAT superfamily N-acetyltransferase
VRLRRAIPDEAADLTALALRSKAYWGYDEEFMDACRAELTVKATDVDRLRITVVEAVGRIVGFFGLAGEPPEADLAFMFVDPESIGQGVGRRLWEHAVTTARALGFEHITIESDPGAEPFYRRMGAVAVGSAPSRSIPGRLLPQLHFEVSPPRTPGGARGRGRGA